MSAVKAAKGRKVGRGRRTLGQLWQVPAFVLGVCAVLALALSTPWRHPSPARQFDELLGELRHGLDAVQDPDALVGLAERLLVQLPQFEDEAGAVHLLAGTAYFKQAEQRNQTQAPPLWKQASDHLEVALHRGTNERELPALNYRLGLALYRQRREAARAIDLMARGLDRGAAPARLGYQTLLQACLEADDLDAAVSASQRLLELSDGQAADVVARVRLNHAELLVRKGLRTEAIRELDQTSPTASVALQVQARLLRARLCEEERLWSEAAAERRQLLAQSEQAPGGKAAILLALGLCYSRMQPPNEAEAARAWRQAAALGGPAAQAAGLRLGELRMDAEPPELAATLTDWEQALASVKSPADYQNPHIDLDTLRALFERALLRAAGTGEHAQGQALAALYRKVAAPGGAEAKLAEATEAHAQHLLGDPSSSPEAARAEYRRAGHEYEVAARVDADAEYLWQATRCYLSAQEPALAAAVLDRYGQAERNEERLAEGWLQLGEAFRGQNKQDEARRAYYKCIEFPATPYACRARYQLASELLSKKEPGPRDLVAARDILEQNLKGASLDREAHEKSLYKLAWVLGQLQDFDRAAICLKEATSLYPNHPLALFSRQQLGECYRRLAEQAYQRELEHERKVRADLPDDKRQQADSVVAQQRRSRRDWLDKAVRTFQQLADELEARGRANKSLSDAEQVLLRRAIFNSAENHFDLGDYPEALRLYRQLLERHRGKVEGLIACERICRLVNVMTQSPEQARLVRTAALEAVRQAEDDLRQLDVAHPNFQGQGVWSRQNWLDWIAVTRRQLSGG
jgi:hypothetical protein